MKKGYFKKGIGQIVSLIVVFTFVLEICNFNYLFSDETQSKDFFDKGWLSKDFHVVMKEKDLYGFEDGKHQKTFLMYKYTQALRKIAMENLLMVRLGLMNYLYSFDPNSRELKNAKELPGIFEDTFPMKNFPDMYELVKEIENGGEKVKNNIDDLASDAIVNAIDVAMKSLPYIEKKLSKKQLKEIIATLNYQKTFLAIPYYKTFNLDSIWSVVTGQLEPSYFLNDLLLATVFEGIGFYANGEYNTPERAVLDAYDSFGKEDGVTTRNAYISTINVLKNQQGFYEDNTKNRLKHFYIDRAKRVIIGGLVKSLEYNYSAIKKLSNNETVNTVERAREINGALTDYALGMKNYNIVNAEKFIKEFSFLYKYPVFIKILINRYSKYEKHFNEFEILSKLSLELAKSYKTNIENRSLEVAIAGGVGFVIFIIGLFIPGPGWLVAAVMVSGGAVYALAATHVYFQNSIEAQTVNSLLDTFMILDNTVVDPNTAKNVIGMNDALFADMIRSFIFLGLDCLYAVQILRAGKLVNDALVFSKPWFRAYLRNIGKFFHPEGVLRKLGNSTVAFYTVIFIYSLFFDDVQAADSVYLEKEKVAQEYFGSHNNDYNIVRNKLFEIVRYLERYDRKYGVFIFDEFYPFKEKGVNIHLYDGKQTRYRINPETLTAEIYINYEFVMDKTVEEIVFDIAYSYYFRTFSNFVEVKEALWQANRDLFTSYFGSDSDEASENTRQAQEAFYKLFGAQKIELMNISANNIDEKAIEFARRVVNP